MATINVRENRKGNQKWTIQKYMQYLAQCIEQRQAKQKTQQKTPKQIHYDYHSTVTHMVLRQP